MQADRNLCRSWGQAHKCDGIKPVNNPLFIIGWLMGQRKYHPKQNNMLYEFEGFSYIKKIMGGTLFRNIRGITFLFYGNTCQNDKNITFA